MSDLNGDWQKLVAVAVLGTDRVGGSLPSLSGPAAAMVNAVADAPAAKVLHAASSLGLYELAGRERRSKSQAPDTAPEDDLVECSPRAGRQLSRILDGDFNFLLNEWCNLARARHLRVPDEQLPRFLEHCLTHQKSTPDFLALQVLGERGHWLARKSTRWRVLIFDGNPREAWQTGEPEQRWAALVQLRVSDPDAARQMVEETWDQEEPDDQLRIVKLLAAGLSLGDEQFLEGALDGKRKPVRTAAAELLASLPSSQYRQRMLKRARTMLKLREQKGLIRGKKITLKVVLPEGVDAAMARDGVENKRQHGMGNNANVLCQILAGTYLGDLQKDAKQTPTALVEAAKASEWKEPLLRGWIRAAIRQHDRKWAEALLRATPGEEVVEGEALEDLAGCLDNAQHEGLATEWLYKKSKVDGHLVMALLCGSRQAWSVKLSTTVLKALQTYFGTRDAMYDHALRKTVVQRLAPLMSPEIGEEAANGWKKNTSDWHKGDEEMVDALVATLIFRREMHEEFNGGQE